ncbi:hypothetical protein ATI53_11081, partial [Salipiger aestuarii]
MSLCSCITATTLDLQDESILGFVQQSLAPRYATNANLIFKWLRDPRYVPEPPAEPDAARFVPAEIVDRPMQDDDRAATGP